MTPEPHLPQAPHGWSTPSAPEEDADFPGVCDQLLSSDTEQSRQRPRAWWLPWLLVLASGVALLVYLVSMGNASPSPRDAEEQHNAMPAAGASSRR